MKNNILKRTIAVSFVFVILSAFLSVSSYAVNYPALPAVNNSYANYLVVKNDTTAVVYCFKTSYLASVNADNHIVVRYDCHYVYSLSNNFTTWNLIVRNYITDFSSYIGDSYTVVYSSYTLNDSNGNSVHASDGGNITDIVVGDTESDDNTAISTAINAQTSILTTIKNGLTVFFSDCKTYFSSVLSKLDRQWEQFTSFDDRLFEKLDYYFNPNSSQLDSNLKETVSTGIRSKLPFIDTVSDTFAIMSESSEPIQISQTVKAGSLELPFTVDFSWYENYRTTIRDGLGILFNVLTFITCLRMILGVFGLHYGIASSVAGMLQTNEPISTLSQAETTSENNLDSVSINEQFSEFPKPWVENGEVIGTRRRSFSVSSSQNEHRTSSISGKLHERLDL